MASLGRPGGSRAPAGAPAAALLLVLAAGCATYSARLADLRPQLTSGAHEQALATVARATGGKDVVLAQLERGLILRDAGRHAESIDAFATAERTAEELYARSLSEGALSLITNDLARSYRARPYELGLVPFYQALNYLALGDLESAMVEARKASLLLSRYVDATVAGIERGPTSDLERTRNDPFLLYFSGLLYEADGELNDAFIAYRNAATAYQDVHGLLDLQIPGWLGRDLERTGRRLGFAAELAQLGESCPAVFAAAAALDSVPPDPAGPGGHGEVVLLVETGFVPVKQESRLQLPILESDAYPDRAAWAWDLTARAGGAAAGFDAARIKYWLAVAVPHLPAAPSPLGSIRVAAGPATAEAVRAHHPAAAASITFAAEQPTVLFRTVLRGLTKYLATREAGKQGKAFGVLSNILGAATETADTRGWLTLPGEIHLARLRLPAGEHDLRLELRDPAGRPVGVATVPGVLVRRGDWTFASHRVFDPHGGSLGEPRSAGRD